MRRIIGAGARCRHHTRIYTAPAKEPFPGGVMLIISDKQMQAIGASLRAKREVGMVVSAVREHAGAATLPNDALLTDEVQATLRRCDELGLASDADRLTLCLWELTLFPGLRDLPELPEMLEVASGPPDARLTALFLVAPPRIWATLMERGAAVRRERGWP